MDGSTDESTTAKLLNYEKPRTRVLHTKNRGLSAARNTGIKDSIGNYILMLDADDSFEKSFLQKAFDILENEAGVGAVSCWVIGYGTRSFLWKMEGGVQQKFFI